MHREFYRVHEQGGWKVNMTTVIQDVRFALRQLCKAPGFTLTVLLTLALGIGVNAAIFTLVNAVLLQDLPVVESKSLIRLGNENDCCVNAGTSDSGNYSLFPTETYEQLKKNIPEFEELAAMEAGFGYRPVTVRREGRGGDARSVMAEFVSGNYFRTFGLQPRLGRLFSDADDAKGSATTAIMSYQTWQREYAGDASVVGSTFWVNTKPVTVVGIAPAGFFGDRITSNPPEFYLPIESMAVVAGVPYVHDPRVSWLYIIGRVKPGVALVPLQDKVSNIVRETLALTRDYAGDNGKKYLPRVHVVLTPGGAGIRQMQEQYASNLRLLTWIAGIVLLIACANVANLLLVRGMARRVELCVRSALGAMPRRIVRQLLTESLLLASLGGLIGLAVAFIGAQLLLGLAFAGEQQGPVQASPSLAVITFAFGLSLVTGVLFGCAPAWIAARTQPVDALRGGSRATASGASRLQKSLVILQAALSFVLLVGAGLFAQSLSKLQSADLKLDLQNRYIVHINPQAAGYGQTKLEALYRTMEQKFHALPGVRSIGISTYTPMEDNNSSEGIQVQGQPFLNKGASWVRANSEHFDAVGTHVLMGRGIQQQDTSNSKVIAVVNESFVREFFKPGTNPIGQHFGSQGEISPGDFEIVGIVEDTAYSSIYWKNHSMFFIPMMQRPKSDNNPIENDLSLYAGALVIQTERPIPEMEEMSRHTLSSINPNLAIVKFQTFEQQIADQFKSERMITRLSEVFGGLALVLAMVGLYGVTAYTVERRTPEIGIRMAVGAERGSIIAMVLRGAFQQIVVALVVGIPIALVCVRFVKAQLYEITSASPFIIMGAVVTLTFATFAAGLIPARRAASVDPAEALRTE